MDNALKILNNSNNNNIIENSKLNPDIPIIKYYHNISIFSNAMKDSFNTNNNEKTFIKTENNILKINNNLTSQHFSKKYNLYNLYNYEKMINKNINHLTYAEESEDKIIKNHFESLKLRTKSKEISVSAVCVCR